MYFIKYYLNYYQSIIIDIELNYLTSTQKSSDQKENPQPLLF